MSGRIVLRATVRVACVVAAVVPVLVTGVETTSAAKARKNRRKSGRITVMARNLYLGADIGPAVFAIVNNPQSIPEVLGEFFANVRQTDIELRAQALADEIVETRPDVVGIQEAALWRTQFPSDAFSANPTDAETVVFDFIKSLRRELRKRGQRYRVAVTATGGDVEFPALRPDFVLEDVRLTVRDVILVRRGVRYRNRQASNYDAAILLPFVNGTVPLFRQWVAIDVKVRKQPVRIISTHLEDGVEPIQAFQARELLAWPANTDMPTVIMGDLNTDPTVGHSPAPYLILAAAGFRDAWLELRPNDPGKTGWQDPLLGNEQSELTHRIDYVLTRGAISATSVEIVGEADEDRIGGLWPSDHAGVVAELLVEKKARK